MFTSIRNGRLSLTFLTRVPLFTQGQTFPRAKGALETNSELNTSHEVIPDRNAIVALV